MMCSSLQDGWTALQMASVVGKVECVKMLLDRSGQVNMQSRVSDVIIHCVHAMQEPCLVHACQFLLQVTRVYLGVMHTSATKVPQNGFECKFPYSIPVHT